MRIAFEELSPGMWFGYAGPRVLGLLPGGVAVGQVIGLDPGHGVVHVRTFRPVGADPLEQRPEILHIPFLFSAFRASVRFLDAVGPVPASVWPSLSAWRERRASGEVGAFSRPLWKVERLIWSVLDGPSTGLGPANAFVEYAFPKLDPSTNSYRIIEVAGVPLVSPSTA